MALRSLVVRSRRVEAKWWGKSAATRAESWREWGNRSDRDFARPVHFLAMDQRREHMEQRDSGKWRYKVNPDWMLLSTSYLHDSPVLFGEATRASTGNESAQFHPTSKSSSSRQSGSTTTIPSKPNSSSNLSDKSIDLAMGNSKPKKSEASTTITGDGKSKQPQQQGSNKVKELTLTVASKLKDLTFATGRLTLKFIRNPLIVREWGSAAWVATKHMLEHTWTGFKLLGVEMRTSSNLIRKRFAGHQLTRRERRQLVRTTADLARMDSYKEEENMKRQLKLRLELAGFLQDMVSEMENKARTKAKQPTPEEAGITVQDVQHFMEQVRMGANIDQDVVIKVAKLFSDELTTDNMSRSQLVTLCKYMGLAPYGGDQFLRFQLRNKINSIREDDVSIFFEGVESLNIFELKQASQERGMRATGLTMHQLRTQLRRWIDLSVNKNVPLSLLILSRAFTLTAGEKSKVEHAISEAISQMDSDVLQEALVAGAESKDVTVDQATLSRLKLEAIRQQNEMIQAEIKEKARKQAFLEQLRQKAQAELEAQEGQNAGQISLEAVRKTVEEKVEKINVPLHAESLREAVEHQAKKSGEPSLKAPTLSPLDKELKLEPNAPDTAEPLSVEQETDDQNTKEFTETLETIKILASDSSLVEEKNILEEILEKQEAMDAAKAVDSGRIVKSSDDQDPKVMAESLATEKGAQTLLRKKVKSMLDKLELDLEQIDEKIGTKLKLLDLDADGKISGYELRQAIVTALKKQDSYTDEKADRLIALLDLDKDGIIDLEQLDTILQNLKEQQIRIDGE